MKKTLEHILKYWKDRIAYFEDSEGNSDLGKMLSGEWKIVIINGKQVVKLELEIEDEEGIHKTLYDVDSLKIREVDSDGSII